MAMVAMGAVSGMALYVSALGGLPKTILARLERRAAYGGRKGRRAARRIQQAKRAAHLFIAHYGPPVASTEPLVTEAHMAVRAIIRGIRRGRGKMVARMLRGVG